MAVRHGVCHGPNASQGVDFVLMEMHGHSSSSDACGSIVSDCLVERESVGRKLTFERE
jgi:hypothetical protein